MKLTDAEQQYVAQRAQWYFEVKPNSPDDGGDSFVLTGDGVDDLDSALLCVARYPRVKIICEVGQAANLNTIATEIQLGTAFPKYLPCDAEDIQAIRTAYIAYYGTASRPPQLPFNEVAQQL